MTLSDIRALFTSRYVLHLESEVAHLRGNNQMLLLELKQALVPTPVAQVKREFPKFKPAQTSWDAYLAEQIKLQEEEESSGT